MDCQMENHLISIDYAGKFAHLFQCWLPLVPILFVQVWSSFLCTWYRQGPGGHCIVSLTRIHYVSQIIIIYYLMRRSVCVCMCVCVCVCVCDTACSCVCPVGCGQSERNHCHSLCFKTDSFFSPLSSLSLSLFCRSKEQQTRVTCLSGALCTGWIVLYTTAFGKPLPRSFVPLSHPQCRSSLFTLQTVWNRRLVWRAAISTSESWGIAHPIELVQGPPPAHSDLPPPPPVVVGRRCQDAAHRRDPHRPESAAAPGGRRRRRLAGRRGRPRRRGRLRDGHLQRGEGGRPAGARGDGPGERGGRVVRAGHWFFFQ